MAKKIHVVPHKDGWAAKREGNDRVSKIFENKSAAVNYGRKTAKQNKTELIIHKKDGKIQDSDSYGNDPNPPKDKTYVGAKASVKGGSKDKVGTSGTGAKHKKGYK